MNLPLIAAGVIILTLHWQDTTPCEDDRRGKWRLWALVSVLRMMLVTPVVVVSRGPPPSRALRKPLLRSEGSEDQVAILNPPSQQAVLAFGEAFCA